VTRIEKNVKKRFYIHASRDDDRRNTVPCAISPLNSLKHTYKRHTASLHEVLKRDNCGRG